MRPHFMESAGNPASSHHAGRRARQALEEARERVAALLDAYPDEVIFTSGATEANNLALFGLAGSAPGHLLVSPVEHPCVLEPARRLAENGFRLDLLPVDVAGLVSADTFAAALRADTRLTAVMYANHETGIVQMVSDLARLAAEKGVPFHCDAAAAVGRVPIRFHELGVTTLTLSAHKFHGPKGIGALLVRREAKLRPQLWGGHQQQGRRPGTEPVPLAVGMAAALELAGREWKERLQHVIELYFLFLKRLS
jgi:cysteine desulfurase